MASSLKIIVAICVAAALVGAIVVYFVVFRKSETQSGSAVYLPGDNIASPLEMYDAANPEYATVAGMTRRRVLSEIQERTSQDIASKYPMVVTDVHKQDLQNPEASDDDVSQASAAEASVIASIKASSPAAQSALKMYLNAGSNQSVLSNFPESANGEFTPMYALYRT